MPAVGSRCLPWVSGCLVFLFFLLILPSQMGQMLTDADPFWHIAAGDWIRSHRAMPVEDPWSFTAGHYPWYDISWAWEILFSFLRERLGWYGALACNVMVITQGYTLLYAACLAVSGDVLASFLTVLAVSFMCSPHFRPLQVTQPLLALWVLVLGSVTRDKISRRWLVLLPLSAVLWVNVHGGFLAGFLMLAAYFAQELSRKRYPAARGLFFTGVAAACALFLTPWGVHIVEATLRPLTGIGTHHISEWMPFDASYVNLVVNCYAVLFVALVRRRPAQVMPAEFWLAWLWLLLGLTSQRHLPVFAFLSAPVFACRLHELLIPATPLDAKTRARNEAVIRLFSGKPAIVLIACVCFTACVWIVTPSAARLYGGEHVGEPQLAAEIGFIEMHYPHIRLLNSFSLGGPLIYEAGGRIPVFMDGRTETAYPLAVVQDYFDFDEAKPGWESILDRYAIDGILIEKNNSALGTITRDRFISRKGWVKAFEGPRAILFVREGLAP